MSRAADAGAPILGWIFLVGHWILKIHEWKYLFEQALECAPRLVTYRLSRCPDTSREHVTAVSEIMGVAGAVCPELQSPVNERLRSAA